MLQVSKRSRKDEQAEIFPGVPQKHAFTFAEIQKGVVDGRLSS